MIEFDGPEWHECGCYVWEVEGVQNARKESPASMDTLADRLCKAQFNLQNEDQWLKSVLCGMRWIWVIWRRQCIKVKCPTFIERGRR
jgi:hypothetical protein